jgi:endonuclease YncB( thermonuclease family)
LSPPVINYARRVLEIREVHDGDTFRLLIDQGLGDARELWVRLHGIDTPELRKEEPIATQAREAALHLLTSAENIIIQTFKTSRQTDVTSFIRYVADVWIDGQSLADMLRSLGYAKS